VGGGAREKSIKREERAVEAMDKALVTTSFDT